MTSQVDVCNFALGKLGQEPIIALDGNDVWALRCSRLYEKIVKEALRVDAWRFATVRAQLPKLAETPRGYKSKFSLPLDFLKLVAIKLDTYENWSLEGNALLTNTDTVEVMYISETLDPNKWTPDFQAMVEWKLALELSGYVTTSTVRKQETYELYQEAMRDAINLNAQESQANYLSNTSWIDARFTEGWSGAYAY